MKRKYSAAILICIIAIIIPISITPVSARRLQKVSGTFNYLWEPLDIAPDTHPGTIEDKTLVFAKEYEWWSGDFEGIGTAVFIVIVDNDTGDMTVDLLSMFIGNVGDKEGGLVIRLIGTKRSSTGQWFGFWEITRGEGQLKNLHGFGTWGGPGFGTLVDPDHPNYHEEPGYDIWYKGWLR